VPDLVVERNVSIPLRDGVVLRGDVYRPNTAEPCPVLLQRTAYGKQTATASGMLNALAAADRGYAVVIQDCRGRYESEGEWTPFFCEIDDGYDTVEWCAAQPWSNGRVGMYGMSYVGASQWLAAISTPPSLQCIFPVMTAADYYDGWIYQGGALYLGFTAAWTAQFLALPHVPRLGLPEAEAKKEEAQLMGGLGRLKRTLSDMPLDKLPWLAKEGLAPYFYEWLRHPSRDEYWERINILAHHDRVAVPAFNVGGWYDLFLAGPPRNFAGLCERAANATARAGQKLLIGPWAHNNPSISITGERNFGPKATVVLEDLQFRWFDHWLKDIDSGLLEEPPVRIFVMGSGWRDEQEWPLARTEYQDFYLHSGGRANGLNGDGRLGAQPPGTEQPDLYLYNPLNPVGSIGAGGAYDQTPAEQQTDVLIYTTPPLQAPIEVTGNVRLILHAATTATDTDFYAKLVDLGPDGYAQNLCDGILRGRYRESMREPRPLTPGEPHCFEIDMTMTSNLFKVGHAIRLEVTSSCFPRFERNPNGFRDLAAATTTEPAIQTVFHDSALPSRLVLPVIPQPSG
jgi:putative CocE/NonD family hydrolase